MGVPSTLVPQLAITRHSCTSLSEIPKSLLASYFIASVCTSSSSLSSLSLHLQHPSSAVHLCMVLLIDCVPLLSFLGFFFSFALVCTHRHHRYVVWPSILPSFHWSLQVPGRRWFIRSIRRYLGLFHCDFFPFSMSVASFLDSKCIWRHHCAVEAFVPSVLRFLPWDTSIHILEFYPVLGEWRVDLCI